MLTSASMQTRISGIVLFCIFGMIAPAVAWNLAPCSPASHVARAAYERKVRQAEPGTLKYVPTPFPRIDSEVIVDYRYHILSRWGRIPNHAIQTNQALLVDGLQRGLFKIDVLRVENWGTRRCNDPRSGEHYFLLLIRGESGKEFARAAVHESGEVESTGFVGGKDPSVPAKSMVAGQIAETFTLEADDPVYVTTTGTLRCDVLMPCIAMRAKGSVYLVTAESDVFEIPANRKYFSHKRDLPTENARETTLSTLDSNESITSIGGDQYVVVRNRGRLKRQ